VAVTILVPDMISPIAILAYRLNAEGLADVIVVPSCYVQKFRLSFMRTVKRYLKGVEETIPNLRRLETRSWMEENTTKWMESLGFTLEGIHPNFAPDGSTYATWARVK